MIVRNALPKPAALSRALFDAAVASIASPSRRADREQRFRFASSNKHLKVPGPLPKRGDGGFKRYLDRASEVASARDVSFVINGSEGASVPLFDSSLDFLSGLFERIGTPLETETVIFATRSRLSAFGIHRDPVSNFCFVAEGQKTFLLWPQNSIAGDPEIVPNSMLPELRRRAQKVVLDAGDMLYMPRGYYHLAVQDGFSVHLNLIITMFGDRATRNFLLSHIEEFLRDYFRGGAGHSLVPNPETVILDKVPSFITEPLHLALSQPRAIDHAMRSGLLRTLSADGFAAVPPPADDSPLKPSDWVVGRRTNLLAMTADSDMFVGARGQVYGCPAHPRLIAMLEALKTGEPVRVRDLLRRFSGTGVIGGEEVLLESDFLLAFLGNLTQARWLKRLDTKPAARSRPRKPRSRSPRLRSGS